MFRKKKEKVEKKKKIKGSKLAKKRLAEFEAGKILQVDNHKDNKAYFKSLEENK